MTTAIPILVGVTGRRCFSDDPSENADRAEFVRRQLTTLFLSLSVDYPSAPKVLMTGGTKGTDLIAARAALDAGADWSVALILPYEQAIEVDPGTWTGS